MSTVTPEDDTPITEAARLLVESGQAANRQEAEAMLKKLEDVEGDPEDDDVGDPVDE